MFCDSQASLYPNFHSRTSSSQVDKTNNWCKIFAYSLLVNLIYVFILFLFILLIFKDLFAEKKKSQKLNRCITCVHTLLRNKNLNKQCDTWLNWSAASRVWACRSLASILSSMSTPMTGEASISNSSHNCWATLSCPLNQDHTIQGNIMIFERTMLILFKNTKKKNKFSSHTYVEHAHATSVALAFVAESLTNMRTSLQQV